MSRYAFILQVRPEMLDEYIARHSPVWPEMLTEIAAAGRRNYSIFLDRERSELFGSYECDDDEAARSYLAASEVASRWEADMAPFFIGLAGRADQAATPLTEVFNLEQQLQAIPSESEN